MSRPPTPNSRSLEVHAKLFRGLADRARLGILLRLAVGSHSAGELASACALSPSNASNHLRCLLECGLVRLEPRGRYNVYRLVDPGVIELLAASEALLESPAGTLISECGNYEPVSRRSLRSVPRPEKSLVGVGASFLKRPTPKGRLRAGAARSRSTRSQ